MGLMLSCHKATELIEKKGGNGLSTLEKFKLFLHKSMCSACAAYEKQSRFMDRLFREKSEKVAQENQPVIQNDELKQRIISRLEE